MWLPQPERHGLPLRAETVYYMRNTQCRALLIYAWSLYWRAQWFSSSVIENLQSSFYLFSLCIQHRQLHRNGKRHPPLHLPAPYPIRLLPAQFSCAFSAPVSALDLTLSSLPRQVQRIEVSGGHAAFLAAVAQVPAGKRIFALFCGGKDPETGASWCPDCVQGLA